MRPLPDIYVSSCCSRDLLGAILRRERGVEDCGIELGASGMTAREVEALADVAAAKGIPLLAHNYFFPAEKNFVLNLADPDAGNRAVSLDYVCRQIDFCKRYNIPAYSFHSGFACSLTTEHFSRPLVGLPSLDMREAYNFLNDNLRQAAEYASRRKIRLLIENNVLCVNNLTNGKNLHLLCVTSNDIRAVFTSIQNNALGLLLDTGHLKVSSASIGLSFAEEVLTLLPVIDQVHLHDNNSIQDLHQSISDQTVCLDLLRRRHVPLVLEQPGLTFDSAMKQIDILKQVMQ